MGEAIKSESDKAFDQSRIGHAHMIVAIVGK